MKSNNRWMECSFLILAVGILLLSFSVFAEDDGPVSVSYGANSGPAYGGGVDPYTNAANYRAGQAQANQAQGNFGSYTTASGERVDTQYGVINGRTVATGMSYTSPGNASLAVGVAYGQNGNLIGYDYQEGGAPTTAVRSSGGGGFDVLYYYNGQTGQFEPTGTCDLQSTKAWFDQSYRDAVQYPGSPYVVARYAQAQSVYAACIATERRRY